MKEPIGSVTASDTNPGSCDGIDHKVSADRLAVLAQDAYSFNQLLKTNEITNGGNDGMQHVESASQSFYQELVLAPIGERKALLQAAEEENRSLVKGDPAMPILDAKIDSDAFLESLTIHYPVPFEPVRTNLNVEKNKTKEYVAVDFVYQGWGMCAEFGPPGPYSSGEGVSQTLELNLPPFKLPRHKVQWWW